MTTLKLLTLEPKPGRIPPSDLDAEAAVLSAALLDSTTIEVARSIVSAEHFYADANRRIFEAIIELTEAGQPADVVSVAGLLRDTGRIEQIGGTPYLFQIADATPSVANVATHAQRVHEKLRLRQLIATCQLTAAEGYGDCGDVQSFAERASASMRAIAESTPARSFAVLDSDEIFAELAKPDDLIDEVIRRGSLVQCVAYGSSGKTWLAVDAALSVAAGVPWLGRFSCKTGLVTYVDYENGRYEMRRRFQKIARGRGLPFPVRGIELASMPNGYMSDDSFGARMMTQAKGRDLVIIDTLKAANPGVDENDSRMRNGLDQLRRVGEATGCAFLVLVHSKKVSGSTMTIDPREAGRGSSAIFDAADSVLHVIYEKDEPMHVTQTKARTGRTIAPFDVTIEDVSEGVCVLAQASKTEEAGRSEHFDQVCDRVVEALKANPGCSARFLRLPVKANPNTIRDALEYLERNGVVVEKQNGKKAAWYFRGNAAASGED